MIELKKNAGDSIGKFEPLTIDEALALKEGDHVWYHGPIRGDAVKVIVSGKPIVRLEVPIKYREEQGKVNEVDIKNGMLVREV